MDTRSRILAYLKSHPPASAAELARALQMTAANIRHHLKILVESGAIEVIGWRPAAGRGRSARVFGLVRREHNLDRLVDGLLTEVRDQKGPAVVLETLRRLARRMAASAETPTGHLTHRLNQAVHRLNELHYRARWEAHARAPRIRLGHCPYSQVIAEHPELCQMDAYLIAELIGVVVEQTEKLVRAPDGQIYCRFHVAPIDPEKSETERGQSGAV